MRAELFYGEGFYRASTRMCFLARSPNVPGFTSLVLAQSAEVDVGEPVFPADRLPHICRTVTGLYNTTSVTTLA